MKLTFEVKNGKEFLINEETFDESGNLLSSKDINSTSGTEKKYKYNSSNQIIEEIEYEDGIELTKYVHTYDSQERILSANMFLSDELYESVMTEYTDKGFIQKTMQDNEEISKLIVEKIENVETLKFYESSELIQIQEKTKIDSSKSNVIKVFDSENSLISKLVEQLDSSGLIIKNEEFDEAGNLIRESNYEYKDGLLILEKDLGINQSEVITTYEYDDKKNLIKEEVKDISGNLDTYKHFLYDNENRVVELKGVFNNGSHRNGFHYKYLYE